MLCNVLKANIPKTYQNMSSCNHEYSLRVADSYSSHGSLDS